MPFHLAVADVGFTERRITLFENSGQECIPVLIIDDNEVEGTETTTLVLTERGNVGLGVLAPLVLMERGNVGLEIVFNPIITRLVILDNDLPSPSPSSPEETISIPGPSPTPCKNNLHDNFALLRFCILYKYMEVEGFSEQNGGGMGARLAIYYADQNGVGVPS